jgi:hypothetical protein
VSVTTDGFITDLDYLEERISEEYFLKEFKSIRYRLCEDNTGLELKIQGRGILPWTTRGQLGIDSKIIATKDSNIKLPE